MAEVHGKSVIQIADLEEFGAFSPAGISFLFFFVTIMPIRAHNGMDPHRASIIVLCFHLELDSRARHWLLSMPGNATSLFRCL